MSDIIDQYYTIAAPTEGLYKEKGSKFISYAYPVKNEEEVEARLLEVRDLYRANDDGEPSGTAGKPILGQLHSHEVTDLIVVVVRYFGGTKLGASGLITAYKEAAKEALHIAEKKEVIIGNPYQLSFGYDQMGHVMNCIKNLELDILDKSFTDSCVVIVNIRLSQQAQLIERLKAVLLEVSLEQIDEETEVPFCKIERLEEIR